MAARIGNALLGLDAIRMTREVGPVAPVRPPKRVTAESDGTEPSRSAAAVFEFSAQAIAYAQASAQFEPVLPVYPQSHPHPELAQTARDATGAPESKAVGGLEVMGSDAGESKEGEAGSNAPTGGKAPASDSQAVEPRQKTNATELTEEEEAIIKELKQRDNEVRVHENAHRSAGGQYAGSPSYTFQVGPDGKRYAIGGEVPLDVGPVKGDPQATIKKMETIVRAALAPAEPSSADYRIAANARSQMNAARVELNREQMEGIEDEPTKQNGEAVSEAAEDSTNPLASQATGTETMASDLAVQAALDASRISTGSSATHSF